MPSPFPGMDPYLESPEHWSDFHHRFIDALSEAIADRLPEGYFARIDEHVVIIDPDYSKPRLFKPDVLMGRDPSSGGGGGSAAAVEIDLEPEILENVEQLDLQTQGFIEIVRLPTLEPVTVVEVLSPANKNGGRGQYLEKRELVLRKRIGLVELDLLREGRAPALSRPLPAGDYYAYISRCDREGKCEVYHWGIRRRLPTLPFPLHPPDADVRVDLQSVFQTTYERGRYGRMIDYRQPPAPPFGPSDAEWVAQMARQAVKK